MFELFTNDARRVVVFGQEEAKALKHGRIGPEHLLLGVTRLGENDAAKTLESLGISLDRLRANVEDIIGGYGEEDVSGHVPFTDGAKKALELSLSESMTLRHDYIGPEHILLGLIREGDGIAAQELIAVGAELTVVRKRILEIKAD